ncbi:MAG: signal peptide peptidase SppA [Candidatus Eisenbacteria bacterium]|nr:signal peptide peptidase SppA [Candidatus Eisenbacteria bacterium]
MARKKTIVVVVVLVSFFFLLPALAGLAVFGLLSESKPKVESGSVLALDLRETIEETTERPLLESLQGKSPASLLETVRLLRAASEDPRIDAVFIRAGMLGGIGWAGAGELREAILEFRKSGKPVHVYIDYATDLAYMVAAAADRIAMPLTGALLVDGIYGDVLFFKNLFAKADISFEEVHVGDYKSAPEIFTRDSMSEPFREQIEAILDNRFDAMLEAIADGRSMSLEEARRAVDGGPYLVPEIALEAGLIDTICFRDDFDETLGLEKDDGSRLLAMEDYRDSGVLSEKEAKRALALVYVVGDIVPGEKRDGLAGPEVAASGVIADAIEEAAEDDEVEAIVVRVSSPGGSATASDDILAALEAAKTEKPVVVSMGDVAASGGYWVSSGANLVFADATTVTGSIGVFALRPVFHRFFDKIGIGREELQRGRNADIFASPRPWSEEHRNMMKAGIDHIYDLFLAKVAAGRGLPIEEVEKVASGRVWSGEDAARVKLIDRLGGVLDAIDAAKSLAGIPAEEEIKIRVFPKEQSILEKIREADFGIRASVGAEVRRFLARYEIDATDLLPYAEEHGIFWAYLPFRIRE